MLLLGFSLSILELGTLNQKRKHWKRDHRCVADMLGHQTCTEHGKVISLFTFPVFEIMCILERFCLSLLEHNTEQASMVSLRKSSLSIYEIIFYVCFKNGLIFSCIYRVLGWGWRYEVSLGFYILLWIEWNWWESWRLLIFYGFSSMKLHNLRRFYDNIQGINLLS